MLVVIISRHSKRANLDGMVKSYLRIYRVHVHDSLPLCLWLLCVQQELVNPTLIGAVNHRGDRKGRSVKGGNAAIVQPIDHFSQDATARLAPGMVAPVRALG